MNFKVYMNLAKPLKEGLKFAVHKGVWEEDKALE